MQKKRKKIIPYLGRIGFYERGSLSEFPTHIYKDQIESDTLRSESHMSRTLTIIST